LTLETDELKERNRYLERKYASLVERCGASQEDLEAVEVMMASGLDPLLKNGGAGGDKSKPLKQYRDTAQERDRLRERNHRRLDKVMDEPHLSSKPNDQEFVDSYDYYGE
jgi:hypothetical protein